MRLDFLNELILSPAWALPIWRTQTDLAGLWGARSGDLNPGSVGLLLRKRGLRNLFCFKNTLLLPRNNLIASTRFILSFLALLLCEAFDARFNHGILGFICRLLIFRTGVVVSKFGLSVCPSSVLFHGSPHIVVRLFDINVLVFNTLIFHLGTRWIKNFTYVVRAFVAFNQVKQTACRVLNSTGRFSAWYRLFTSCYFVGWWYHFNWVIGSHRNVPLDLNSRIH